MNYYHVRIKHSCKYLCQFFKIFLKFSESIMAKQSGPCQELCLRQSHSQGDLEPTLTISVRDSDCTSRKNAIFLGYL